MKRASEAWESCWKMKKTSLVRSGQHCFGPGMISHVCTVVEIPPRSTCAILFLARLRCRQRSAQSARGGVRTIPSHDVNVVSHALEISKVNSRLAVPSSPTVA